MVEINIPVQKKHITRIRIKTKLSAPFFKFRNPYHRVGTSLAIIVGGVAYANKTCNIRYISFLQKKSSTRREKWRDLYYDFYCLILKLRKKGDPQEINVETMIEL